MSDSRREFMKLVGFGLAGSYLGASTTSLVAQESANASLAQQVAGVCKRLGPHGWRELFLKLSDAAIDLADDDIIDALTKPIAKIDRSVPGFEDFAEEGKRGIEPGSPARSLLFHALASSNVVQNGFGKPLEAFPTLAEIEIVENFVYGVLPPSMDELKAQAQDAPLGIVVFCREYRSGRRTVHGKHADLCFSRTATARTGTIEAMYDGRRRDFVGLDDQNPFAFRVIPTRFAAYIAMQSKGDARSFGPLRAVDDDKDRDFWVPMHKLFAGRECLRGYDLIVDFEAHFLNEKLRRLHIFFEEGGFGTDWDESARRHFPFVMKDGMIAAFASHAAYGTGVIEPRPHPLFEKAKYKGQPLTFEVPGAFTNEDGGLWFSSLQIVADSADSAFEDGIAYADGTNANLGRTAPEYINARHKILPDGSEVDLNQDPQMMEIIHKGGYRARHYIDFTGDGWIVASSPQLVEQIDMQVPAYVGIAPPDFFPAFSQGDLMEWWSDEAPEQIREGVWCIPPLALSDLRMAGNVTLDAGFNIHDDTITAVVSHPDAGKAKQRPYVAGDAAIFTRLPDGSNGVFDPGWDFSQDTLKTSNGSKLYLANYGLGVPFIEDAKLCAALGSYWPAVSPDSTRTFQPGKKPEGRLWPWPTIVPLTDEEIGSKPLPSGEYLPWDGLRGPAEVVHEGRRMMRYPDILHVDYLNHEGRLTASLTAKIDLDECKARVVAMAAVYWALGIYEHDYLKDGDWHVGLKNEARLNDDLARSLGLNRLQLAKSKLAVGSFRKIQAEAEVRAARQQTEAALDGNSLYRFQVYTPGDEIRDPQDFRYLLVEIKEPLLFYVDPQQVLMRRENGTWEKQALFATP